MAVCRFLLLVTLLLRPVFAQTSGGENVTALQEQLVAPWTISIEGDPVRLVVVIKSIAPGPGGTFALDTLYGQLGGAKGRLKEAALVSESQGRKLLLTTAAGNKMDVAQKAEGVFEGTFTTAKGIVRNVTLTRISGEALRDKEDSALAEKVAKPNPDVPASCAGFLGRWTGKWPYYGQTWLWVVEIDSKCLARYAHTENATFPTSFRSTTIKDGVLADADAQGNGNHYELRDGDLWARHVELGNAGRNNNAVFRRF